MIQLSILIPSTPSRWDMTKVLFDRLELMAQGKDIEILCFFDNKKRSIGAKREALKNISKGKYFMFVDSDDDLLSINEIYEATFKDVDVITFKQRCRNQDGSDFIVTFGLGNEVEHNTQDGRYLDCKRPPFQMCPWHHSHKGIRYPNVNYGEDGVWSLEANKKATIEHHIDKIIHSYNFDINVSEASTQDNEHWKNPNHESHS